MKHRNKRIIKVLSILIILAVLAIWLKSRWGVWFSNLPEPEYTPPLHPARILITTGGENPGTRIFSWVYGNKPAEGSVEIANTQTGDTLEIPAEPALFKSRSGEAVYYKAVAAGLPPSTYTYRICHPGDTTENCTFTIQSPHETTRLIFIGDIQDIPGGNSGRLFHEIDSLYPDVTLYVLGGDVIERPMNSYWDYWYSTMREIAIKTPVVAAAGNHEYLKGFPPELEERFYHTFPIFDRENSGGNACACVSTGKAAFFIIDSNKEFWTYPAQRSWLKKKMNGSDAKWKIVVLHHPIYSMRGRLNNMLQRMAFNPVIKECGATLVLQGHEHAYMRRATVDKTGKYTTPIYITSHCSPKNYRIGFSGGAQRYGGGDRYYQYITISDDTLTVETYNSAHILYDKLQVTDSCGTARVKELPVPLPETVIVPPDMASNPEKALKYQHDIDLYFSAKKSSSKP